MVVQTSKITPRVARRIVGLISGNIPARKPTTPINLMRKFVVPFSIPAAEQSQTVKTLVDEAWEAISKKLLSKNGEERNKAYGLTVDATKALAMIDVDIADLKVHDILKNHPSILIPYLESLFYFVEDMQQSFKGIEEDPFHRTRSLLVAKKTKNYIWVLEEFDSQVNLDARGRRARVSYFGANAINYVRDYHCGRADLLDSRELRIIDNSLVENIKKESGKWSDDFFDECRPTIEKLGLTSTLQLFNNIKAAKSFRDGLEQRITDITASIRGRLSETLGLRADHAVVTNSGTNGHYGAISMGMSLRLELRQTLELGLEELPGNFLEIEVGLTVEEMKERVRTLNFLVHHEMGHLIQNSRRIPQPIISEYQQLDQEKARHHANEVVIDKLAFEAARNIYVAGEGDALFDQETRELIAIKACLTLSKIVLRNQLAGVHNIEDEFFARSLAVLLNMSKSNSLSRTTEGEINEQLVALKQYLFRDKDEAECQEFNRLIEEYSQIYSQAYLAI